eukprot:2303406-Alexandrium_andersonii.AAC.1
MCIRDRSIIVASPETGIGNAPRSGSIRMRGPPGLGIRSRLQPARHLDDVLDAVVLHADRVPEPGQLRLDGRVE